MIHHNMILFTVWSCQHLAQPPNRRVTPCRLSATAYSTYSQIPSALEAVPPLNTALVSESATAPSGRGNIKLNVCCQETSRLCRISSNKLPMLPKITVLYSAVFLIHVSASTGQLPVVTYTGKPLYQMLSKMCIQGVKTQFYLLKYC